MLARLESCVWEAQVKWPTCEHAAQKAVFAAHLTGSRSSCVDCEGFSYDVSQGGFMAIELDDSRWPLVIVTFRGSIDDQQFNAYLKDLERNIDRAEKARTRTALMFDAENGGASNAAQRKAQAEWIKANFERSATWCAGYAFVIPNGLVRGMLQAILWFSPMPSEHTVVKTREEADEWLSAKLKAANASLTVGDGRGR